MTASPDTLRAALQAFGLQRDRLRTALSRATGIAETDLNALEQLESDGPLTPKELADRLQLTSGGATVLADRLERAGWVKRRPHPSDRRSLLLELDPDAVAKAPDALVDYHAAVAAAAHDFRPSSARHSRSSSPQSAQQPRRQPTSCARGASRFAQPAQTASAVQLLAQVGEHGEHAAVVPGVGREAELREDARHVLLDRALGDDEPLADRLVRAALGHQLEHLALARGELVERVVAAAPADEQRDDLGVERRAALADAPHGGGELVDVGDAVLEQVADALGALGEQLERVLGSTYCESTSTPIAGIASRGSRARRAAPRRCASAACGCRRSRRPGCSERTFSSSSSALPAWPTTSKPASSSSRATPSRSRTESSARTTRTGQL